jgi:hypothetical protein
MSTPARFPDVCSDKPIDSDRARASYKKSSTESFRHRLAKRRCRIRTAVCVHDVGVGQAFLSGAAGDVTTPSEFKGGWPREPVDAPRRNRPESGLIRQPRISAVTTCCPVKTARKNTSCHLPESISQLSCGYGRLSLFHNNHLIFH